MGTLHKKPYESVRAWAPAKRLGSLSRSTIGLAAAVATLMSAAGPAIAAPPGTAFTYQGFLLDAGSPANGTYAMTFELYDDELVGSQQGSTISLPAVSVVDGVFTVSLDFGVNPYADKQALWLGISVDANTLSPRQALAAAPFALNSRGITVDATDNVCIGSMPPDEKLTVDGNILLTNAGGPRTIGLPVVNLGGEDLTIQAGGNASSHEDGDDGGNLILRAGNANTSSGNAPPAGTSSNNDVMIYAGDNTFSGSYGSFFNGNIRFFGGEGQPERMRLVGDNGFLGIGTMTPANRLSVSGAADFSGNVGIGTTSPGAHLHIAGGSLTALFESSAAVGSWIKLKNTSAGGTAWNLISTGSANGEGPGKLMFGNDSAGVRVTLDNVGNVGIGTSAPSEALQVIGNICATGTIGVCSDARFKEHVEPVAHALDMVERLRGVMFDWKREQFNDHKFAEGRQLGFIAQEVRKVLPQVVSEGSDGYLSVDYGRLTPVIIEALKQVRSEKDEQIATLRDENAALKARLDRIESLLGNASK